MNLIEMQKDNLDIYVSENMNDLGCSAGIEAARLIRKMLQTKDELNLMFAAAPSQDKTLSQLLSESDIEWSRINAFHMDEYIGLSEQHSASFRNYLKRTIFNRVSFRNVYLLNGTTENPKAEAERYDSLLCEHPLDLCLLGIGENGHIAFNDPHVADFSDPLRVKIVELEPTCKKQQVHDGCFEKLEDVPDYALTVTIPVLMKASHLICSVPRATKAKAVREMLLGEISENCPASIMRRHPSAKMYLDRDAAKYILE